MAGPRANLAVTKDGETYNKLQRPDNFLERSAGFEQINDRKRERAAVDRPTAGSAFGNKRAKTHHTISATNFPQSSNEKHQHRGVGPASECGMRMTLPIDEEDQHSDDSMGEALAYLRSVRSEASAIPHLLVASKIHDNDADNDLRRTQTASTSQSAFYQDGAWISVDECYEAAYNDSYGQDDLDPQESYHTQLIKRFEALRSTLSGCYEVNRPVQKSDAEAAQSMSKQPPSNRHEWLYTLDREYPTRAQISRLDEKSVRRGLEYCVHAMDRFDTISSQKSCWIWTLLALSSDIGTLDSQKMSHIRDLGIKAGQLSVNLHQGIQGQNRGNKDDFLHSSLAADGSDDAIEASEIVFRDASGDVCDSAKGYVRSGRNELPNTATETTLNEDSSNTRHSQPPAAVDSKASEVSTGVSRNADTDMNDDTLERARARLLAQLGDNLVQAGIPASAHNTDETRPHRSEQSNKAPDALQHKVKIRTMPSRAEAERQRQMLRTQYSATGSLREAVPVDTGSTVTGIAAEEHGTNAVDLNTRVTIDMILTVVAECYGQRDLLKFRKPW